MSHEKNPATFQYTGCYIEILMRSLQWFIIILTVTVYTWIVKSPTYPKQPRFLFIAPLRPWPQPPHPSTSIYRSQILRSLRSPTGAELCRGIGLVFQDFWLIVTSARMDGQCSEEKIMGVWAPSWVEQYV